MGQVTPFGFPSLLASRWPGTPAGPPSLCARAPAPVGLDRGPRGLVEAAWPWHWAVGDERSDRLTALEMPGPRSLIEKVWLPGRVGASVRRRV